MERYTLEEKVQIIKWHYGGNSLRRIRVLFEEQFPGRECPSVDTIGRIRNNFENYGCLTPRYHKSDIPEIRDEQELLEIMVLAAVDGNPAVSSRIIAENLNTNKRTVLRILKKHRFRSFKIQKTQELFPQDNFRRMEFCETVTDRVNRDENFIKNIAFSDESTFPIHGRHNPSAVRYWATENLHRYFAFRSQYPQKLNVWAGMLGDNVIGPYYINGTLTGDIYLRLLEEQIIPEIRRVAGEGFDQVWFQQDGCPAHNTVAVRACLDNHFPGRVMSRLGNIVWPARSPDLAPNDFFFWGYVKSKIYGFQEDRANSLEELRIKISDAFQSVTPGMLANMRRSFYDRLGYCLLAEGNVFEPLIH